MAGTVITVAQQKGGAGKTTLVAHLAVAFARNGQTVATLDIDPQASLTRWHEERAKTGGDTGITHSHVTGWRTANEVDRLKRAHDVVLIDSPPHAETEARLAVRSARIVLVPVQPSPMDFWATEPTLTLARQERTQALVVLNRVPPRARLADWLVAKAAELGADVADTQIGNRIGFADAMLRGRSVVEGRRTGRAGQEIEALAEEILRRSGR